MLGIVAGHLWTAHAWVRPVLFTWHVPIFFFLAGYLWNEHRSLVAEVRHRAMTVLLPCLAWIVVLALLLERAHPASAVHDVLHQLWESRGLERPFWAFWFAPALFVATVGYRLLCHLGWTARTLLVLGTCAALPALASAGHLLPLNLTQGLVCTLWVLAGHGLRCSLDRADGRGSRLAGSRTPVGLALLTVAAGWIATSPTRLDLDLHRVVLGAPALGVLCSLTLCTGLTLVGTGLPDRRVPEVISDLARAALVVMLVHLAVIEESGGLGHPAPGQLVVVLAASWAVGLVLLALPRTGWLTGQRPAAPRTEEISRRIPQPVATYAE